MFGKYELGNIIRGYRQQKNVSQADLCRGICSPSHLSRIEHGETEAPLLLAQTLLERLGVGLDRLVLLLEEGDYKLYQQRREIIQAIRAGRAGMAGRALAAYEEAAGNDKLENQYVKYCKAKLWRLHMQDSSLSWERRERLAQEAEQLLEEAAALTIPGEGWNMLLGRTEIGILLAQTEGISLKKLKYIQHFVKSYYSKGWVEEYYPKIQLKYAAALAGKGKCRKALAEIEEGLAVIKAGKSYCYCADLYFLSVQILERLGKGTVQAKEQEELARRCQQAYSLYTLDGNPKAWEVERHMQRYKEKWKV